MSGTVQPAPDGSLALAAVLLLGGRVAGRPTTATEAVATGVLVLLALVPGLARTTSSRSTATAPAGTEVDEARASQQELERMAYSDHLTGLPDRARLMAALAGARDRVAAGEPAAVLLLDLDGFKAVNDIAGHEAGDLLLVEVADRLRATVRDHDLVSRLGGDEFAVLVRSDVTEATVLGERIVAELAGVHRSVPTAGADDLVFDVSCSIGVAELHAADDVSDSLRHADVALRAAKAARTGCVRMHGASADDATARRTGWSTTCPTPSPAGSCGWSTSRWSAQRARPGGARPVGPPGPPARSPRRSSCRWPRTTA